MRKLLRDITGVAAALVAAVLCAQLIAFVAMFAISHGVEIGSAAVVARVVNFVLVPLAAGTVIGAFRTRRPLVLAVLVVAVSLAGTYRALGPTGLPHGWKIAAYLVQTAIIALAAVGISNHRASTGGPQGDVREAVGLTNAEADKRSEEARFARHDATRLQLSWGVRPQHATSRGRVTASQIRVAVLGAAAVVTFDILASLASRRFGFAYARASFGSYLIYLGIGFFAARVSASNAIGVAALVAGIAGLIDASIGWAVSWALGPGRLPETVQLGVARWVSTALIVVVFAAAVGALGGIAGRRWASDVPAV
jgi:hypothetical protein